VTKSRMTLSTVTLRLLRNLVIAVIIALTIALAPIVRADTVRFVRTVFGANLQTAVLSATTSQ
jgi:hypothetical protein